MSKEDLIYAFISLLKFWNKRNNFIQSNTMNNILNRHVEDSLQIKELLNQNETILDIGTGAGFPGIVLSIYGIEHVILCEKNFKKVVFLKEVKRKLGLNYEIFDQDIYTFDIKQYNASITAVARAFGSLSKLLDIMNILQIPKGIFHKGQKYKNEIEDANLLFEYKCEIIPSKTNLLGAILEVSNIKRRI